MSNTMIKQQWFSPSFVRVVKKFTANGETGFFNLGDHPMKNWALQVFGVDANGNIAAPTAWTVAAIGSLAQCAGTVLTSHVSGTQTNGQVTFAINSSVSSINVALSNLNLGTATALVAVLEGTN